jgi:hypothetical protein
VGAARVVRDVAADGADLLARRVGREVESHAGGVPGEVEVDDPGLHPGHAVVDVDLETRFMFLVDTTMGRAEWDRATGQAGAGAAGHDRNPMMLGDTHHLHHLCGGGGHRHHRRLTVIDAGIGPVQVPVEGTGEHAFVPEDGTEILEKAAHRSAPVMPVASPGTAGCRRSARSPRRWPRSSGGRAAPPPSRSRCAG